MAAKANGPKMPAPRPAKPAAVPAVALMRPYLSQQNEQNKEWTLIRRGISTILQCCPALPGQVVAPAAPSVAAIVAPPPSVLRQRAGRHAPQQQAREQGADKHGRQPHSKPELETDRRHGRQAAFYNIGCLEQVMSCRAFNTSNNWLSSSISVSPSCSGSRRIHCAVSWLVMYPRIVSVSRVHLHLFTLTHSSFTLMTLWL